MAATTHLLPRRRLLVALLPLVLAACPEQPAPRTDFPPPNYSYLAKIKLLVATIDIDNESAHPAATDTEHVEQLSPVAPADALTRMARDRLITAGNSGHAIFRIVDASLTRAPDGFEGAMHVRLDLSTSDGARSGYAEARASRTYTTSDTSPGGTRAALYELVKLMMSDMNVEFEYQVRHTLRDYLAPDDDTAPPPPPVQSQDLNPGAPPAPPPPPPAQ